MDVVRLLFVLAHLVGLALLLGGFLVQWRAGDHKPGEVMWWGGLVQLVTGAALVGLREAQDLPVDHMKIGIKLLVALAVVVLILLARRRTTPSTGMFLATGALTFVNAAIAVLWV
ncbi:hypothetical protein C1701_18080 [Actinoalloteichus sp. AHMU CJ021]|uniref:Integral membrane protein n=1 Tax=Actinoalloteichus caeruleus DSM 43889 TaxID=1120930 RepID=A0ABT1JNJ6_ACTCY|nr:MULTISPECIES: hypothetical protein [Actinoalloteichus]AUS79921.1 hypothetical protein C1701_18080 [Actinoalloteichus sp. AHMU CJ021]MCP2334102.1 hypothetical protein [Actinoalloteichus caeruleus DSM 43889]